MNRKKLVLLAVIIALVALFFAFDLGKYLTLQSLKENHAALVDFSLRHRAASLSVFIAVYILQSALSLPGAAVLSLAAGAVFGVLVGTLAVNIGATIGAALAFLAARHLFRDSIQKRFGSRLQTVNSELERSGLNYLLFLRLVPVFPFFLINLGAGLTALPLRTFFIGTMIGIIPGSVVFCNAGASLASISSLREVVSPRVLGSFALLGVFALIPALYQKWRKKNKS